MIERNIPKREGHPTAEEIPEEGALLYVFQPPGRDPVLWAARKEQMTWDVDVQIEKLADFGS